jgi:Flp pilus assembly protein TadD
MDRRNGDQAMSLTIQQTQQAIRALGLSVVRTDGEWRINLNNGSEATAYCTSDNDDALATARALHQDNKRLKIIAAISSSPIIVDCGKHGL